MNTKAIALTRGLARQNSDLDIPWFLRPGYREARSRTDEANRNGSQQRSRRRSPAALSNTFRRVIALLGAGALFTGGFWLASQFKNPDKPDKFMVTVQATADYMPGGVSLVDTEKKSVTPSTAPKAVVDLIRRSDMYLQAQEPDKVTTSYDGRTYQPVQAIFVDDPSEHSNYVMNEDLLQLCLLGLKDTGFITMEEYETGISSTSSLLSDYKARTIVQGGMARLQAKYNITGGQNGAKVGEQTFGALFDELNSLYPNR